MINKHYVQSNPKKKKTCKLDFNKALVVSAVTASNKSVYHCVTNVTCTCVWKLHMAKTILASANAHQVLCEGLEIVVVPW